MTALENNKLIGLMKDNWGYLAGTALGIAVSLPALSGVHAETHSPVHADFWGDILSKMSWEGSLGITLGTLGGIKVLMSRNGKALEASEVLDQVNALRPVFNSLAAYENAAKTNDKKLKEASIGELLEACQAVLPPQMLAKITEPEQLINTAKGLKKQYGDQEQEANKQQSEARSLISTGWELVTEGVQFGLLGAVFPALIRIGSIVLGGESQVVTDPEWFVRLMDMGIVLGMISVGAKEVWESKTSSKYLLKSMEQWVNAQKSKRELVS